jgi:hypothetical protein
MYPTSPTYDSAVYATARSVTGKVAFAIVDTTAAGDVSSITVTTQAAISNKDQSANGNLDPTYNLATWEVDRFRLDGSFSFPDSTLANNGEVGYISDAFCNLSRVWTANPTITVQFTGDHSSAGISVVFDEVNNEYAEDFTITIYDSSNTIIETLTVTANTDSIYSHIENFSNYRKVELEIQKWNVADRRARVLEIAFGVVQVYTDESLIRMSLIEDMDLITGTLPSPEFKFTVDNSSKLFNILNPTGFYFFLQQRQPILAKLGVDIGGGFSYSVPLGNFQLVEWVSDEGTLTASFTARTNLDTMANFDYEQLTTNSQSLYDLAEDLFTTCGITNYSIDTALQSITTNSMAKKTTCRNALQMVAIAGEANIFVTRNNTITIKQLTLGTSNDRINFDNAYKEPEIKLDPIVKQVDVTHWSNLSTSAISSVTSSATAGDVLKIENNTFINNGTRATAVANWILSQKNNRAEYRINWRGNPAQELADVIDIENAYTTDKKGYIIKNDIRYEGYLSAVTNAKGAI